MSRFAPCLYYVCLRTDRWVTADADGGLFRLSYADGMVQPFEVYTFNALYDFVLRGEFRDTALN